MRMVRTVYRGPYEGLGAAWGEFDGWIAAQGYEAGADLWECYLAGPESNPDPDAWRTEFSRALVGQNESRTLYPGGGARYDIDE